MEIDAQFNRVGEAVPHGKVARRVTRAVLLPRRPPRVTRNLSTPEAWLVELGAIYREARRHELPTQTAARLAWIASQGSKLAREIQELRQLRQLQEQLARLEGQGPVAHVGAIESSEVLTQ